MFTRRKPRLNKGRRGRGVVSCKRLQCIQAMQFADSAQPTIHYRQDRWSVFLTAKICNVFLARDGGHRGSRWHPQPRRASPMGPPRVFDSMSSHSATESCELFSSCSPSLPRTLAPRRHKRRLATPPSRNSELDLEHQFSSRLRLPGVSPQAKSKPLRLISTTWCPSTTSIDSSRE